MRKRILEILFESKNATMILLCLLFILSLYYFPIYGLAFFFITFGLMLGVRQIRLEDFDKSWSLISETPPNEMLEVMDEKFNLRKAVPVYRNYTSSPTIKNKKLGIDVTDCEPYWDGSWMFDLGEDEKRTPASHFAEFGKVTRWRKIETKK